MTLAQGPWNTQGEGTRHTVGVCCAHHFGVGEGTVISGTALPAHAHALGLATQRPKYRLHLLARQPPRLSNFPTSRWFPRTGLTLWPSWSGRPRYGRRRSRRPCHSRATSSGHQRYPADNHGYSERAIGPERTALSWGWGSKPELHGMQGVRGSNPLSSTRHNASSPSALSVVQFRLVLSGLVPGDG
jgi:hypothetical protein